MSWIGCISILYLALNPIHDPPTKFVYRVEKEALASPSPSLPEAPPFQFPSLGVQLLSWVPHSELAPGSPWASDTFHYASPSGREYALITHASGIVFWEVTDPGNPEPVASFSAPMSYVKDVKTHGNYAYFVSDYMIEGGGGGIQVFDLGGIDQGQVSLINHVTDFPGLGQVHNLFVHEETGYLYAMGGGFPEWEGMRIFDLTHPGDPQYVSQWQQRRMPDALVVRYDSGPFAGREIAFCYTRRKGSGAGGEQPGLDVLDVTNKQNIYSIRGPAGPDPKATVHSHYPYPQASLPHQAWLSEDKNYLYLNDEWDEKDQGWTTTTTRVIDVRDPSRPREVSRFSSGRTSVDHNLYVVDQHIFEANYTSGLRIFDTADPLHPVEVGYFDTHPEKDSLDLQGMFNADPFLPSRTIIASDLQKGLFLLFFGNPALKYFYPGTAPSRAGEPVWIPASGFQLPVQILEEESGTLMDGTASLHLHDGQGFVSLPLIDSGGGSWEAPFPSMACGQEFAFYLSAKEMAGRTWKSPPEAPYFAYQGIVAENRVVHWSDDMEEDLGWTVGSPEDTAHDGIWVRENPVGSLAQPEEDHSASGSTCWITGQGNPGEEPGFHDVDGGQTTLVSPMMDIGTLENPYIEFWAWFFNQGGAFPGEDSLSVEMAPEGEDSWVSALSLGPNGYDTGGGWRFYRIRVKDFLPSASQIRIRVVASDAAGPTLLEAALDDFQLVDYPCSSEGIPAGKTSK